MKSLFVPTDRTEILERLDRLQRGAARQWGKMEPAQMLAHCTAALEVAVGDTPREQALIGKLFGPFVKKKLLGPEPFSKNSPTDPAFVILDPRDFTKEKTRLLGVLARFCDAGPAAAHGRIHSFLGRLEGEEWGVMMFKHLDHHLRQFGA
ncbi:MAG TPA: DUF1569 domain-containing protein [Thermoanaerobaculia bacterium]|nr:DUF1569 domain-containing protein [Thermoanaerobaculia bacterium]